MFIKNLSLMLIGVALGTFGLVSNAFPQSASVGDETVAIGSATVSVPWNLEAGGGLRGVNIDVTYDTSLLTPQVDGDGQLIGCVDGDGPSLSSCQTIGDGSVIRIALLQLIGAIGNQNGALTFDITGTPADGDTTPLTVELANINPADTTMASTSGSVTFQALTAVLNVQPEALDFGNQQTGSTSDPEPITISNQGTDGLDLQVTNIGVTGDFSLVAGTCPAVPFALGDGASCTQNVQFTPAADGAANGTLTVTSDAGQVINDAVALSGNGVPGPQSALSVSGPLDFGSIDLNDLPDTAMITATNTGDPGSSLTISAVNYTGDAAFEITSDGCAGAAGTLADNQSCTVQVSFNTAAAGNYTGTVSFTSDAATNPTPSVSVLGTATATANISVNPDFGPVNLGTGEAGDTLTANGTITNSGSAAAEVSCVLDDPSGVFSTAPSPLAATVDANSTVPFALSCALPTAGEQGDAYAATLTCSVDRQEVGVHELSCDITDFVPVPVPTMSSWSIALFALLMLLVGGFSIRMFRIQ